MPRLKRAAHALGVLTLGTGCLMASPAAAQESEKAKSTRFADLNVAVRGGFASGVTTGQNAFGGGLGLSFGATFRVPMHVELGMSYHFGTSIQASNDTLDYASVLSGGFVLLSTGYDFALLKSQLVLRPYVAQALVLGFNRVQVGESELSSTRAVYSVGPGFSALYRFGRFQGGVEAHALYLPTQTAAPVGALYAVLSADLFPPAR